MKSLVIIMCILSMLSVFAVLHQPLGEVTAYEVSFWNDKEPHADEINALWNLYRQDTLLYLEPGDAPYFFRANSSCRYVCPLPVQRDRPDWDLSGLPESLELEQCILSYQGEFVVFDAGNHNPGAVDWFGENFTRRKEIMDMIRSNYTEVYNQSWRVYQRK